MLAQEGLYTGPPVTMGSTDDKAVAQKVAARVSKSVLWLYEFFSYAGTETKGVNVLETFSNGVRIRCEASSETALFLFFESLGCGEKTSGESVSHCADRNYGLCKMGRPLTAADFQQFL